LSLAAFGLVEAIDRYQIAQVYLTLTYDKLGDPDRAREAAHRLVLAERVERKYASLPLAAAVRTAFEAAANRLLTASESAMLLRGAAMNPPPPATTQQRAAVSTRTPPSTPPPRATTVPQAKPQPSQASASQPPPLPAPRTTTPESAPHNITPTPQATKPPATKPATTATARPAPAPPKPAPPKPSALTASEVATRLTAAERGLNAGNLNDARRAYRELLGASGLDRETLIRIAEGLYRARDFSSALTAFNRVGTLRRGEEAYRYYIAVAFYETGDVARAKKELAAALPYIEVTPDVARYRTKIEGSL
jgi:tetratricopeptide (TPR) repeat protein